MTAEALNSPRRKRSSAFGATVPAKRRVPLGWRLGLVILPVIFSLAHLAFGLNQTAAALWFTAIQGLALIVVLATPLRRGMFDLAPTWPLITLLSATIGIALWSLTPYLPGGAHPLYGWAGIPVGAGSIDRGATVVEIVKLLGLAAAFLVGALQGMRRSYGQATLEGVVWAGSVYASVSLIMFLSGTQVADPSRLSGGFLSANSGATIFGVLVVLSLSVFLRGWRRTEGLGFSRRVTKTAAPLSCLSICAVCLILTASRMGLAATVAALAVLLLWETASIRRGRAAIWIGALLLTAVGIVLALGGNDLVWTRIDEIDADMDVRGEIFAAHWQAFLSSPLFGYGLGSFDSINNQIISAQNIYFTWPVRATHSVYLQWLEEAGIIGSVPMFLLIGTIMILSVERSLGGTGKGLQRALVCASLVVLLHGLTDYALQVPSIAGLWAFLLGVGFAFGQARG